MTGCADTAAAPGATTAQKTADLDAGNDNPDCQSDAVTGSAIRKVNICTNASDSSGSDNARALIGPPGAK